MNIRKDKSKETKNRWHMLYPFSIILECRTNPRTFGWSRNVPLRYAESCYQGWWHLVGNLQSLPQDLPHLFFYQSLLLAFATSLHFSSAEWTVWSWVAAGSILTCSSLKEPHCRIPNSHAKSTQAVTGTISWPIYVKTNMRGFKSLLV